MANNRHIPNCIIATVLHCGRHIIALRDDGESVTGDANPCNVLAMLKLTAKCNIHFIKKPT